MHSGAPEDAWETPMKLCVGQRFEGGCSHAIRLVLVGSLILAVFTMPAAIAGQFVVEARLLNGQKVTGTLVAESVEFNAISSSGEVVSVKVKKPPDWSTVKLACEIVWLPEKRVFVVRDLAWTGELSRLWKELTLIGNSGNPVIVRGSEIEKVRFVFVENPMNRR